MSAFIVAATRSRRLRLSAVVVGPFLAFLALNALGLYRLAELGLVGLAGALALAVVFTHPRWGLYFLVFHVYAGLNFYIPGVVPAAVLVVTLSAAAIELVRGETEPPYDAPFWSFTGLFTMACIMSMLVAHYPIQSMKALLVFFKTLAVVYLVLRYIRTPEQLTRLVLVAFVGALATIALGLINMKLGIYMTENVIMSRVHVYRFSGTHANPNAAAAVMCATIPFGVFVARNTRAILGRVLSYAGVGALVVGMFMTFSRSAIVAFSFVAVALIAREVRTRAGYLLIAALLAVAILLTPQYYWDRLRALQEVSSTNIGKDMSVLLRYTAMKTALHLSALHPWLGIGLQNFIQRGATDVVSRIVVHNTYLEILVGTGVFGLATYLGILASGLRHALGGVVHVWKENPAGMRSISFYVLLAGISYAISALFGSRQFSYFLWIPVACSLVLGNLRSEEQSAL